MTALDSMDAPAEVSRVSAVPWEADLYLILCYKWWLNVGTTQDMVTLVTSTIYHNGTAKNCMEVNMKLWYSSDIWIASGRWLMLIIITIDSYKHNMWCGE